MEDANMSWSDFLKQIEQEESKNPPPPSDAPKPKAVRKKPIAKEPTLTPEQLAKKKKREEDAKRRREEMKAMMMKRKKETKQEPSFEISFGDTVIEAKPEEITQPDPRIADTPVERNLSESIPTESDSKELNISTSHTELPVKNDIDTNVEAKEDFNVNNTSLDIKEDKSISSESDEIRKEIDSVLNQKKTHLSGVDILPQEFYVNKQKIEVEPIRSDSQELLPTSLNGSTSINEDIKMGNELQHTREVMTESKILEPFDEHTSTNLGMPTNLTETVDKENNETFPTRATLTENKPFESSNDQEMSKFNISTSSTKPVDQNEFVSTLKRDTMVENIPLDPSNEKTSSKLDISSNITSPSLSLHTSKSILKPQTESLGEVHSSQPKDMGGPCIQENIHNGPQNVIPTHQNRNQYMPHDISVQTPIKQDSYFQSPNMGIHTGTPYSLHNQPISSHYDSPMYYDNSQTMYVNYDSDMLLLTCFRNQMPMYRPNNSPTHSVFGNTSYLPFHSSPMQQSPNRFLRNDISSGLGFGGMVSSPLIQGDVEQIRRDMETHFKNMLYNYEASIIKSFESQTSSKHRNATKEVEELKQRNEELMAEIQKLKLRNETLTAQHSEAIKELNVIKVKGQLQESKILALSEQLSMKTQENTKLAQLCDELINSLEATQ